MKLATLSTANKTLDEKIRRIGFSFARTIQRGIYRVVLWQYDS